MLQKWLLQTFLYDFLVLYPFMKSKLMEGKANMLSKCKNCLIFNY